MPVWLAIVGAVVSCTIALGGVVFGVGALVERIRTLETRHGEGMKEMREGRQDHEQRLRSLEKESTRSSTQLEASKRGGA